MLLEQCRFRDDAVLPDADEELALQTAQHDAIAERLKRDEAAPGESGFETAALLRVDADPAHLLAVARPEQMPPARLEREVCSINEFKK